MSGTILQAAGHLIAAGVPIDALAIPLEDRLRDAHEAHEAAVREDQEPPDPERLALLVAAGWMELGRADYLLGRDVEDAIDEVKYSLQHPGPGDDPRWLRREMQRLEAVRKRRNAAWSDALGRADFALDSIITYTAAALATTRARPTAAFDEAIAAVDHAVAEAIDGQGPRHVLVDAAMGTRKTHSAMRHIGRVAAAYRQRRLDWIRAYHRSHPGTDAAVAAEEADAAGVREFRVLYLAETHELVAATLRTARTEFGLTAEHHAGYDRGYDPADPTSPAVCTQAARRKATQEAGESVPDKACGRATGAVPCPDLAGCRKWQRLANCAHVQLVGSTIDFAFDQFLPHQLCGFDVVILDEALDRVGYGETTVNLDYLSDRHFGPHPVLDEEGQPSEADTDEARAAYKLVRDAFDAAADGYAPVQALRVAGFDAERLLELTNRRDKPSGMTSATPDLERAEIARASFRRQIRSLCGLFQQLGDDAGGWVRLATDGDKREAIVRRVRKLNPAILDARIIALDGSPDLTSWRRFIPDVEVVEAPKPRSPHETFTQIVRPSGKHAMRNPSRLAYNQALLKLYGNGSTGVLTHKEHEAAFEGPDVITGHFGGLVGRNDWKHCETMLTFGLPFLSPEGAAYEGAGRTGEAIQPSMPVRALVPQMLKGGGVALVPSMEYQHPAAREAQAAVRDRQAMQGPAGRPRASSRTADNPVLSIYVGMGQIPGVEFDCVISGPEDLAPDRFVRMVATGLVVESGPDRHRLHKAIYAKERTAEYDMPQEAGGTIETLQRVLFPRWSDRPRETWLTMRYWVAGRGNRSGGRIAACPVGHVAEAKNRLREACHATRIELVSEVHRPSSELPRTAVQDSSTWILGTLPRLPVGSIFPCLQAATEPDWDRQDQPDS